MNIKVETKDVMEIVRELMKYCMSREEYSLSYDEDMARKVLDYAIEQALINNIELKQQIESIVKDNTIKDMIANREMVLSKDEIDNLYSNFRCITEMCRPELPYNKRGYYHEYSIEDVGFSERLTSLLQSYNRVYLLCGLYENMDYFTFNELKEAVNGDKYLIAEFNDKMAKLGFGWSAISKKLRYKYRLVNSESYTQSYFEIDVYKFLKKIESEHDRKKEVRLIEAMAQDKVGNNKDLTKLTTNLHLIKTLDKEFIAKYYEKMCKMIMDSTLSNDDKMELLNYIYNIKNQLNTDTLNV